MSSKKNPPTIADLYLDFKLLSIGTTLSLDLELDHWNKLIGISTLGAKYDFSQTIFTLKKLV